MSLYAAASQAATTTVNVVTTTAGTINRAVRSIDRSAQLLESTVDVWASTGIHTNTGLLAQAKITAENNFCRTMCERADAHKAWLAQDPSRAEAWAAAKLIAAEVFKD